MRHFRLKKKTKDNTSVYCLQERKLLVFWVTIEEIADKEHAKRAIAETREGAFYNWLLKSPKVK